MDVYGLRAHSVSDQLCKQQSKKNLMNLIRPSNVNVAHNKTRHEASDMFALQVEVMPSMKACSDFH